MREDGIAQADAARASDFRDSEQNTREICGLVSSMSLATTAATERVTHFCEWLVYAVTIPKGGVVFHLPRVKSGKSTGRLLLATERTVSSKITLHDAAS